uniref:Thyroglobulin type-1 domain-containing protein n=1 Tax=Panagrellus redivivus TaxID=6233 RepID=A0A7E4W5A3_PANRE
MVKVYQHLARMLLILGVAIVGGSGAAPVGASTSSEVTSQGRRDNSSERCKPDTVCSEKDLHGVQICGTNGKTYANPCELRVAACLGVPVQMHGIGECLLSERCRLERDFQLARIAENATLYVNEFIPECDATSGLYTSIQCHMAIGYCWCSTIKGIAISGTSVSIDSGDRPDCTEHEHRSLSPIHVDATGSITHHPDDIKGTAASECSAADRIQFNSGLLEVFGKAYLNTLKNTNDTESTDEPNTVNIGNEEDSKKTNDVTQKQLIVWKFAQLDIDNNGRLTPAELEDEHRLTLRIVGPKACGRSFGDYCDKNSDKLIDLQEWTNCLDSASKTNTAEEH